MSGTLGGIATLIAASAVSTRVEAPSRRALLQLGAGAVFGLAVLFSLRHEGRAVVAELRAARKKDA